MTLQAELARWCAELGRDPLLVQGAGGNVSWKEGRTLWVKASGHWLAAAEREEIFVPVDLPAMQAGLAAGEWAVAPQVRHGSSLKPSIETPLHALMPQPVVVHLHPVELLPWLVLEDARAALQAVLGADLPQWVMVDYQRPGAPLAAAVAAACREVADVALVFLRNHGVVLGGASVAEVQQLLATLLARLTRSEVVGEAASACGTIPPAAASPALSALGFLPSTEVSVHRLVTEPLLFRRLQENWALYPDHVVFLGASPQVFRSEEEAVAALTGATELPDLIFVENVAVYLRPAFSAAKAMQLRCYYEVLRRLPTDWALRCLREDEIGALLDWDAEKYRQTLAKQ